MKNVFHSFVIVFLFITSVLLNAEPIKIKSDQSSSTIKSLLLGLNSQNLGLRTSSAFMVGELKIENAVIPLMKILRSDEIEEAKLSAALALYKLGTPMSINALYQASKFDESKRVRKICLGFYLTYISEHKMPEM